jgi:flagellar hook-associated protein 1 FlgK
MSGLFESLSIASSALDAQSLGIDVTGENLANVNTTGYSRRTLNLAEAPATSPEGAGGGVDIQGVQALRDTYIQSSLDQATTVGAYQGALSSQLSVVSSALGTPGTSLDAALTSFFNAFSALATDPTNTVNRSAVVQQAQGLAQSFNTMAGNLASAQQSADASVRGDITQANALIAQVASLNGRIAGANGSDVQSLVDERQVDVSQLTNLVGASAIPSSDGTIGLTVGNGHAIVIGETGYPIAVGNGPGGLATLTLQDTNVTAQIGTGTVGALLQVRDTLVPNYQAQLDQLAYGLSTQVNTLQKAGFGLNGTTNQTFFVAPTGVSGSAAALTVDPTLAADPNLVAASSTGTAGDNQTAQAIANLQSSGIIGAGNATPANAWAQLVFNVGQDTASATNAQTNQQQVITQLTQLRDSVSKVSTDDEAATLIKYQQAYLANARYFTVINTTLDNLMTMVEVSA